MGLPRGCLALLIPFLCVLACTPAPAQRQNFVPTYLLEDRRIGITFFAPADFLPNPVHAVDRGARTHWYGASAAFSGWGLFTYHREGPVNGLDPTYWIEPLEAKWGPAVGPPETVRLPDGEALSFMFYFDEKGIKWALQSVLVPTRSGVFDLTVFAPRKHRSHLARFAKAMAGTIRSRAPAETRTYTFMSGFSIELESKWKPVRIPPPGLTFRAVRNNGRYRIDLALTSAVTDSESHFRAAFQLPQSDAIALETVEVPAGRLTLGLDPRDNGAVRAILVRDDRTLVLDAALSPHAARETLIAMARAVRFTPQEELEEDLQELAKDLRGLTRASRLKLRHALNALTPRAGHPAAASALLAPLSRGHEEAVVETALAVRDMAPFGPDAGILNPILRKAIARGRYQAASALLLAIGSNGDASDASVLKPYLYSKHLGVAHAAVSAMGLLPFGNGEAMDAIVTLYAHLGQTGRASRGATRGSARDAPRLKVLYYPILTALRRQSGRDFPHPGGPAAARAWLDAQQKKIAAGK
jgi:hypothetical protein